MMRNLFTLINRRLRSRYSFGSSIAYKIAQAQNPHPAFRQPIMPEVLYATASVKASTGDNNAQSYRSMTGKLNESLLKALEVMGYEYMTPVQSKVLTELPSFRSDCLVQAKTGTGKTVAFLLPTLHSLLASSLLPKGKVGVLIMSPTRELAMQITQECNQLTSQLPRPLECHTAYGGTLQIDSNSMKP